MLSLKCGVSAAVPPRIVRRAVGFVVAASVPVSRLRALVTSCRRCAGIYEALELRDKDPTAYMGKGVSKVCGGLGDPLVSCYTVFAPSALPF